MLAQRKLVVPIPRLLGSGNNEGFQWMLFERMAGANMLTTLYDKLPSQQACDIARQIARVLHSMYQIRFQGCGSLVSGSDQLTIGRPVVRRRGGFGLDHVFDATYSAPKTLLEFLVGRFEMMIADAEANFQTDHWTNVDIFTAVFCPYLIEIAAKLSPPGESPICLYHPDLRCHNFLVTLPPKNQSPCRYEDQHGVCGRNSCKFVHQGRAWTNPQLTGLLDWDDCEALPVELALRVPTWLWSAREECNESKLALWNIESFAHFIGEDPGVPATHTRAIVRETFVSEIEELIPGFMETSRENYRKGLVALGCVARLGIAPSTAGLARGLLKRYGWEDKAQAEFEAKRKELLDKKELSLKKLTIHHPA